MNPSRHASLRQSGFSMVEVLVSLIILLVGLLGLAGLMIQSQRSEMESYQRVQALILLQDMAARINNNRNVATCYAITTTADTTPYVGAPGAGAYSGTVAACPTAVTTATTAQLNQLNTDIAAWNNLLQGAAEKSGGSSVGAMIGARGCVSYDGTNASLLNANDGTKIPGTGLYTLSVAWQGMGDTFAPAGLNCAKGLYGPETRRRVVSLTFRIGSVWNTN